MTVLRKINAALTPARRKRIYQVVAVAGAILVAHGVLTINDMENVVELVGILIGVTGVSSMAAANVNSE